MTQTIKWGILATGGIASSFTQALTEVPEAEVVAVASRSEERAAEFARKWHIPRSYGSYEALAQDPEVEVIYIATPHNFHYENMLLCLNAGKHVLCEKAFTLNAAQAETCIQLAREKGLFLMEAMWTRFFPATVQIREWLDQGVLGELRLIQADMCVHFTYDPQHRLFNPNLGGGALLDLGVYPIAFASMVMDLDQVEEVQSIGRIGATGVDEFDTVMIRYQSPAIAMLSFGSRGYKPREAFIVGTQGHIKVHSNFHKPDTLTLHLNGQDAETRHYPTETSGYTHEIQEVHRCLLNKRLESSVMSLDETLKIMRFMDALRQEWGVVYPEEQSS